MRVYFESQKLSDSESQSASWYGVAVAVIGLVALLAQGL